MNKSDRMIVALLFCLLIGWTIYGRKFMPQPPQPTPVAENVEASTNTTATATNTVAVTPAATNAVAKVAESAIKSTPQSAPVHTKPEKTLTLTNSVLSISLSSWGGGITKAELIERKGERLMYPETNSPTSGPLVMDFSKRPALSYDDLPGLSSLSDFEISATGSNTVEITAAAKSGLTITRTMALTNGYVVSVIDRISNKGSEPLKLVGAQMNIGPMQRVKTKASSRGFSYLGAEVREQESGKVVRWDKKLPGLFGVSGGCSRPDLTNVPLAQSKEEATPVDWVAVKNKFFTQVLIPEEGGSGCIFFAEREDSMQHFKLEQVAAAVSVPDRTLAPGESFVRKTRYYVGPKKFSQMRALGGDQDRIILRSWKGFGWWRAACIGVLWLMNFLYTITHNYGVAIILLTIIVKVVFWPVTHKGTESMKKMKEIQPELTELRKKYKSDPKKLQEKQMQLYRERGVNPVAGCLPMLVQMPVFIALFTVLRNAVELRYQSFLWIPDLCEPEGLLAGVIPFPAGGLNILPLLMAATMGLQQRLTPTAGDPQQQKMMAFMPLMMLFFFYNMASALVLYWTVSQLLSILQLVMQQRKEKLTAG